MATAATAERNEPSGRQEQSRDVPAASKPGPKDIGPASADLLADMKDLHHRLLELRKYHDVPDVAQMRELASGVWRVNEGYQTRLQQLTRERDMLNHQMQHIWRLFDTQLLEPVWSVSDPLLPMYQRLSRILHDLDLMRQRGGYTSAQVTSVQRELNDIENEHMDEWYRLQPSLASDNALPSAEREEETSSDAPATTHSQNSYSILGGQAVLRSLLERCYRLVRLCIEESTPVARSLVPIRNRLLALHLTLRGIKEGAKQLGGGGGDPVEVKAVQERLREIESFSRDGKFVDERGNIPDGQAELRILLEESYALAHSLLVKSEKHETFAT